MLVLSDYKHLLVLYPYRIFFFKREVLIGKFGKHYHRPLNVERSLLSPTCILLSYKAIANELLVRLKFYWVNVSACTSLD